MIIDVEKIEKLVADETISAYEIESKSGVNRTILTKLRRGEADLDNMTLKNLKKIMEYIDTEEKFSSPFIEDTSILHQPINGYTTKIMNEFDGLKFDKAFQNKSNFGKNITKRHVHNVRHL